MDVALAQPPMDVARAHSARLTINVRDNSPTIATKPLMGDRETYLLYVDIACFK